MKVIRGIHQAPCFEQGCVVSLGNYDGVHRGHQALLTSLRAEAAKRGVPLLIYCFEPTPLEFFRQENAPVRLTSFREKAQLLAAASVDYMLVQRFDARFAALSANHFVSQHLIEQLRVKALVVGDDFRFGADRQGDVQLLRDYAKVSGFDVLDTATVALDGARISSTAVRQALANQDLPLAEQLLGRPYAMQGRVMHGDKLGRQLGFPTANLQIRRPRLPLQGVYAVRVAGKGLLGPILGVANLGTRPVVNGCEQRLEVHLLDWSGDLYGQLLQVEFVAFVRAEQRFSGLEALKTAIAKDVIRARELLT